MRRLALLAAATVTAAAAVAPATAQRPHDGPHRDGPPAPGPTAPAPAGSITVDMHGKRFSPSRVTLLAGEQVTWVNDDTVVHDVAAVEDGGFISGRIVQRASHSETFERQGTVVYRCTLHRFMRGTIDVFGLALAVPAGPVTAGRTAALSGRAPARTEALVIEALDATGSAWHPVTGAGLAGDGSYRAHVLPEHTTTYRARAGELSSAPARVVVAARLATHVRRLASGWIEATVHADPPQPRAHAVLQRYDRERFDWRPVGETRLDAGSHATLRVRSRRRERLRVILPHGVGGYGRATSAAAAVPPTR